MCYFTIIVAPISLAHQIFWYRVCSGDTGTETKLAGQSCESGLTSEAADGLGLKVGLPVAVSSLDAHAGALGND